MKTYQIVILIVLLVLIAIVVLLYFLGKKAQKKQAEQQEMLEQNKQSLSMLIIDKKRMKIKDSGLPQMVIDQTPKLMRNSKMPIIKAKVGPQIMSLICDEKIFDNVPVKKEVKAVVSGIYVLDVRGLHGKAEKKPEKKYRKYDFTTPRKFTKDRIKMLHGIFENYTRVISSRLNAQLRTTCAIEVESIEEQKFYEFNNALMEGDVLAMVDVTVHPRTEGGRDIEAEDPEQTDEE